MPPKKKPAESPEPVLLDQDLPEEDEEGPGRVAFSFTVSGVSNLPCELETVVGLSGLCRENRSSPAASSTAPSGWAFQKGQFIRVSDQALYDDIANRELVVTVRDAANNFAVVGETKISCLPFLHESAEVGGEFELTLTEAYHAKWFPDAEPVEVPEPAAKPTSRAGAKAPKGAPAAPVPEPVHTPVAEPSEEVRPSTPFIPPPTTITFSVSAPDLVGPPEDRGNWTTLTFRLAGVFALPERLARLGPTTPEDLEAHPMRYAASLLGEPLGDGVLTRPAEVEDPPQGDEGSASAAPADLSDAEWHSRQERFGVSIRFKDAEQLVRYRGSGFMQEFRSMLNHTGGVWLYFTPEEKLSLDPKKPNPPEYGVLAQHYVAKAWVDLRDLILPGVCSKQACCGLVGVGAAPEGTTEPTFEASRTYVRLTVELSHDIKPPDLRAKPVELKQLLSPCGGVSVFPDSGDAATMYYEAVERSFETICRSGVDGTKGSVSELVEHLKKDGVYAEVKEGLRSAVIRVFRERLRKDTRAIPGRKFDGNVRNELFSGTYTYLKTTISDVLDDLREQLPPNPVLDDVFDEPEVKEPAALQEMPGSRCRSLQASKSPRASFSVASKSPAGGATPSGAVSPGGLTGGSSNEAAHPGNPVAAVLAESARTRRAREALNLANNTGERCARLAYEAELVGNWDRAAELIQSRLLLEDFRGDPKEWIGYAKFCTRSRGRQVVAEMALRQAVQLLAEGTEHAEDTAMEVDLMLACLLLDRGRHDEAIYVFRKWHEQSFEDPFPRFLLGLSLYLSGEEEASRPFLEAVGKPQDWFEDAPDDAAVAEKLHECRSADGPLDPAPYAACLERLLDFGLPSLVFTFLDQCKPLPQEDLACEPLVLIDAKASAVDQDFFTVAKTLESLIASGDASREAWRVAGECYVQIQDFDRAYQAFQHAMSFEQKFDDPAIYIRLGSVLLVKKRWKQARDAFLRSIHYQPTAEAWSGVAYAEFRSEELQTCYEALCEANLLDNERADVWAQLALVHLRMENWEFADDCMRQSLAHRPNCDELMLEISAEYVRHERQPALAEASARCSLDIRDTGQGHAQLAEALARQEGQIETAIREVQVALRLLVDEVGLRKAIFEKALKWCEELGKPDLEAALTAEYKLADQLHAERGKSMP